MERFVINKYIVADPEICHGKLTFAGTRIMVWQVLEMLAAGGTVEEILGDFPSLSRDHITAALEYAARMTEGERFFFSATQPVKFLADENVKGRLVKYLQTLGYDVTTAPKGVRNSQLFALAKQTGRISFYSPLSLRGTQ